MSWVRRTTYYEPVEVFRKVSGNCPVCGKRTQRQQRFTHTVNPFNRNEDGTVRTRDEVLAAVNVEAEAWQPDFRHEACK